uniref:NADH-ubiquinone oxidoreductase chain 5 n=1 Tax=Hippodamia convergens TaxID=64696 RepID=A0A1V0IGM7_HIPCN|nr:NADH dehydrogenase subunit 5 [Hippodamia convergens]
MFMFIFLFFSSIFFLLMEKLVLIEYEIFNLNSTMIEMLLLLDWMSLLFMSFVFFISSMVIFYSDSYMQGDLNSKRFVYLVLLFVISMMLMILSPNLISILLGWDGLGLVSYCLVIYYQNVKSYSAGMLTVLSNRVGDVMLLISIAWILNYGSWNLFMYMNYFLSDKIMNLLGFLILIAAFTKSAQIPFSAWLPAAMAAPTPVSALVHSSTLVTAGVYLLIRYHFLILNYSYLLLFIGLMTMFMSGLGANLEFDLKKIIALSTLSQLGLMMCILGLGSSELAFFHLLIHALFKALLFMCAGNFIHLMMNSQDIRFMGGLISKSPLTVVYFNVSNMALCGLPFMSGFYSKDLIMEFYSMSSLNLFIYLFMFISLSLTVSYSIRLMYYLMYMNFKGFSLNSLEEEKNMMCYSMGVMFFIVLFSGSMMMWIMFSNPCVIILPLFMKMLTLIMVILGGWIGLEVSKFKLFYSLILFNKMKLMFFFSSMWNLPYISTFGINYFFLNIGMKNNKFIDQGFFEIYGGQGLFSFIKSYSVLMQYLFNNNLKIYLMMFVGWMIILMIMNF